MTTDLEDWLSQQKLYDSRVEPVKWWLYDPRRGPLETASKPEHPLKLMGPVNLVGRGVWILFGEYGPNSRPHKPERTFAVSADHWDVRNAFVERTTGSIAPMFAW